MKYFKCVDGRNSDSVLEQGTIYEVRESDVTGNGINHWITERFEEVDNVTKLMIIAGKIKPRTLPFWYLPSREGYKV